MGKPFIGLWRFLLKPITLRVYKNYLKIKSKINKSPFFKDKIGWFFYNRHAIHVIIVIISVFVASTNVLAATETRSEVAKNSKLYEIVKEDMGLDIGSEEEVVKANFNKPKNKNYVDTSALVVANIPKVTDKIIEKNKTIDVGAIGTLASASVTESQASAKRGEIEDYIIKDGESLGLIAGKFGVSLSTLLWANGLSEDDFVKPGQTIKIPPDSGYLVKIASGDTLDDLISKHNADKEETLKFNKGKIDSNENIVVGTEILLAGGKPYTPPAPVVATTSSSSSSSSSSSGSLFNSGTGSSVTSGTLNWPSSCRRISQGVRWGHVAIDINCGYNLPLYAAESGTVSVIPNRGNGYGNYIIINHGNGMQTLYGHLSSFSVQNGQSVDRGQQIGWEGSTGWSTGPHLHFEVIVGGAKQNPWNYL